MICKNFIMRVYPAGFKNQPKAPSLHAAEF